MRGGVGWSFCARWPSPMGQLTTRWVAEQRQRGSGSIEGCSAVRLWFGDKGSTAL